MPASSPLRNQLWPRQRNRFFATCCEIVLAPRTRRPRSRSASALSICLKSKPWCSGNCWSSAAITAIAACFEICVPVAPLVAERRSLVVERRVRRPGSASMNVRERRIDPAQRDDGGDRDRRPRGDTPAASPRRMPAREPTPTFCHARGVRMTRVAQPATQPSLATRLRAHDLDRLDRHVVVHAACDRSSPWRSRRRPTCLRSRSRTRRSRRRCAARVEERVVDEVDEELRRGAVRDRWCGPWTACRDGS